MTLAQAITAASLGSAYRYRDDAMLLWVAPKNAAYVYSEKLDLFILTTLSEEEQQAMNWQPCLSDAESNDESDDIPLLCEKCAVNPATARCDTCGKVYCDTCFAGVHLDGPNIC